MMLNTKKFISKAQSLMAQLVVDEQQRSCASAMVIKDGQVLCYFDAGYANISQKKRISRDSLFRIFSQTKPITGFAAVQSMEQGLFSPNQQVKEYMPEYANLTYDPSNPKPVPAETPMLINHLLHMTAGLPYHTSAVSTSS